MKVSMKKWCIAGTVFTILLGTLLHFVYEWSDKSPIFGILGAVNESTWEHLKLLFWPAIIFSVLEYIMIGKDFNNDIAAKAVSFYVGIILITSLFYTYTGIIGKHFLVADISIFIISVIISQYTGYKIITANYRISKILNTA